MDHAHGLDSWDVSGQFTGFQGFYILRACPIGHVQGDGHWRRTFRQCRPSRVTEVAVAADDHGVALLPAGWRRQPPCRRCRWRRWAPSCSCRSGRRPGACRRLRPSLWKNLGSRCPMMGWVIACSTRGVDAAGARRPAALAGRWHVGFVQVGGSQVASLQRLETTGQPSVLLAASRRKAGPRTWIPACTGMEQVGLSLRQVPVLGVTRNLS